MNPNDSGPPALDDPRLEAVLSEYLAALEAGEKPSRKAFLARHPDLAEALAECLDGMEALHAASSATQSEGNRPGPAADWQPGAALGDFRILREIGRGGMGVVYEAEQLSLGRRIALKVLPFALTLDTRQLQRFKNEAKAAAQLHHQNIVPIYSVGCDRSVHFYAMQYVEGQSLAEVIQELRRLAGARVSRAPATTASAERGDAADGAAAAETVTEPAGALATAYSTGGPAFYRAAAQLGVQAAEALEHAHECGVVHRDIKPGNLLVDVRGHLWVADFGLAQFETEAALTMSGDLLGTLRYMSPEQALAKRGLVDHRTDIYSLGATLYELLTLEPAYDGRDRAELLRQIAFEEPRPPRRHNPGIPPDLETIVLKAMAKSADERYGTARELAEDLRRFLGHQPIRARRPTLLDRGLKWLWRHQALVGTGPLAAVVSLALSMVVVLREQEKTRLAYEGERKKAIEADEQRARAEENFNQARAVVDFFTQLIEEDAAFRPPPFQGGRRKALEAALAYYEGFIEQRRDDPSLQAELATSKDRVAKLLAELTTMQGFGHFIHLDHRGVQDDLGLTPERREQLRQLRSAFWEQQFRGARGLRPDERRQRMMEQAVAHHKELAALLTAEQLRRLKQIDLQTRGPFAFQDPDVVKELQLTAKQQDQIRGMEADDPGPHCEPFPPSKGKPRRDDGGGFDGPRPNPVERVLAVLTPEQKGRWKELTGRPFAGPGPGRGGFGPGPKEFMPFGRRPPHPHER